MTFNKKHMAIGATIGLGLIGLGVLMKYASDNESYLPGFRNYFGTGMFLGRYPRGVRNNNPTNIIKTKNLWKGEIPHEYNTDKRFKQFYDYTHGIRAGIVNLQYYYRKGFKTVRQIITKWAPPSENDTESYIKYVSGRLGVSDNTALGNDKYTIRKLLEAIITRENGKLYLTGTDFEKAWNLI